MNLKEITDLLDVQHSKAMLKVDRMAKEPEFGTVSKMDVVYNAQGQTVETYILDKRQSIAVSSMLNTALLMRVIDRWQELEANQAPALPQSFSEALQLAADQAKQLELAAPKVAFVDEYVESNGNKGFREVSKLLKINESSFRKFLIDNKIMYRLSGSWTAYQNHIDAGRFFVSTGTKNNHAYNTAKFTPKGVCWISELINKSYQKLELINNNNG